MAARNLTGIRADRSAREAERRRMVETQIAARGVRDRAVLDAMREVPREAFVPKEMAEFAYRDSPLPIAESQTISQPYIVALMAEALELGSEDRVLEVGTGSGYAAAVLSRVAAEVYTVERHAALADWARKRLEAVGYHDVRVLNGDGTKGWPEHAPYDAIVAAAGGPDVPESLREQLAVGGRLVMPIGPTPRLQELVRISRVGEDEWRREELGGVRFVPLIGEEGWEDRSPGSTAPRARRATPEAPATLPERIAAAAEAFDSIEGASLDGLLERIGDARVVLLGEATHGTSEFYRMRARITRELVERAGFTIVAAEADWPDASRIDHYVRHVDAPPSEWTAFSRFPTWMWRNEEFRELVDWMHERNADVAEGERVGFYGLDLYSLHTSIDRVLRYLDEVDPEAARVARERYGCLSPWESDPAVYGRAVLTGRHQDCEGEVVAMLQDLLDRRLEYMRRDGTRFHDAVQNARLVANAERYYRSMYYGGEGSWNLRDTHMFETLKLLLEHRAPGARAVIWAHNSHLGDAAATEMGGRGQTNLGRLSREEWGEAAYLVGFGTHSGTVAAASEWDGPMEIKTVRPSNERSYERLCHDAGAAAFLLPLRHAGSRLRDELSEPRLERMIGVIYRPETELMSHYVQVELPRQFDEWIWFDVSEAVAPLDTVELQGAPDTYPFGL
ncbi:MAG: protein-L-isoaspartate(D-aspartate) O-methyltransferase [Gemmatimonadetes bacterium]|nr:protein-L-isoaspartate(D-aspartate) O-methyltransferase [Gemmatimonadota bacterium]